MKKKSMKNESYYLYLDGGSIQLRPCNAMITEIWNTLTNGHDETKVYLIDPALNRFKNINAYVPTFVFNSIDGIIKHYKADIEGDLSNRLHSVLAKMALYFAMNPLGVIADEAPIKFLCYNKIQKDIITKTFADYANFNAEQSFIIK
jgi:hypothetical protein